jgi:alanine racemase
MSDVSSSHGPLGTVARIDTSALTHNLARVRELTPRSRVLAVVKADAYGHGLLRVARALRDADGYAVARLGEAERLRSAGLTQRILLLPGVDRPEDLGYASRLGVDLAVHHLSQVQLLEQAPAGVRINAWLKVDSGMHRLGVAPEGVAEVFQRLTRCACVAEPVRLMTHLSDADALEKPDTLCQLQVMDDCTRGLSTERSIGNSAGIIAWPGARSDWVRPGIMLYGISPFDGGHGADHGLRPVMTLTTRLSAVNRVPSGGAVGYGGTFVADEEMLVGAAAAGYADGYPRHVADGTPVLVQGTRVPLAGRVSMDTITVDLRNLPSAAVGAPVTLWGEGLPVEEIARAAGTIGYELVCRVSQRVPRL